MNLRSTKNLHWFLLFSVLVLLVILSLLSEGFSGGADNISHYFIARYSFKYPHLFLEPWGRPVFTIMASPFCQFGFQGLKLFNVLLGCLTAFLAYLTAKKLNIDRSWLAIIFVIFTPMYFLMTLTGLTEIQFGFILMLAVYLFFDEKYIASAIIISFLPLSRSEGYALIPIFFIALILKRKYLALPFLISGLLLFSVIGYLFIWKDFFWIYHQNPYPLHHPLYKVKGPLLHFINASPEIFGIPLLVLFLAGLVIYGYLFFTSEKKQRNQIFLETWLLAIPVLIFFAVHSVLYWKAWFSSMGLIRVVTGVLPLAALVGLKAYDYLEKTFIKLRVIRNFFLLITIVLIIFSNFYIHRFPVQLNTGEKAMKRAIAWFKSTPYSKKKIFYTDIDVPFRLGLDRFDKSECEQKLTTAWLFGFPDNSIIIWDSYYGTHDCNVPLSTLEDSGVYELLNVFKPIPEKNLWFDPNYQICIFKKVPYGYFVDNSLIRDSIDAHNGEITKVQFLAGDTYEKNPKKTQDHHVTKEVAFTGSFSYKATSWEQFTTPYEIDLSKLKNLNKNVIIRITCYVYPVIPFKDNETRLVVTLKDRNDNYHSLSLDKVATRINEWNEVSYIVSFPSIESNDKLVVYFWHLGKKEFFIDDMAFERLTR